MLLLLLALGCHPVAPPPGLPAPSDYAREHQAATREIRVIRDLETRLLMRATLLNEDLVDAQALTLAYALGATPQEHEALRADLLAELEAYRVVVFAADSPREDFSLDDDAGWRVRLLADEVPLEGVELTKQDPDAPAIALLYPQINRWSVVYRARFARDAGADTLRLVVAGPLGQGQAEWAAGR
ncbi:MAG: hypothetical protein H6739_25070 [Alphaproteobacteria bacterium]|nr:hypothetical protein [Alphaproteobacteria bacterium]